jgi:hypothetical protein
MQFAGEQHTSIEEREIYLKYYYSYSKLLCIGGGVKPHCFEYSSSKAIEAIVSGDCPDE